MKVEATVTLGDDDREARKKILRLIDRADDGRQGVRLSEIPLRLDRTLRAMEASGEVAISWVRDDEDPGTWLHYVRLRERG